MRGILVNNGVVVNSAVFTGIDDLFDGWLEAPLGVGIGWSENDDGTFSPPVIPDYTPLDATTASKLQFIEWCEVNGKLNDLLSLLNSDPVLMFKWNAATILDINHPLIVSSAPVLGITDIQAVFNEISQG